MVFNILLWYHYAEQRAATFISADQNSGACIDDASSSTCCEIPVSVSGTFLADARNNWNTDKTFSYINGLYYVSMAGLKYTIEDWTKFMLVVQSRLELIGDTKGSLRDFAWNVIAWASFTVTSRSSGYLQFSASGDVGAMFNKPITIGNYASRQSDIQSCVLNSTVAFEAGSREVSIATYLPEGQRTNPCSKILSPETFGFDRTEDTDGYMKLKIDMAAVTTALAVNMGMTHLGSLENFEKDANRRSFLQRMVKSSYITDTDSSHISSYYDKQYAPTSPIYW